MDFEEFLKKCARDIEKRLEEVFVQNQKQIIEFDSDLGKLFQEFKNASSGGKRLRGALVLLGYQAAGGKDIKDILDAAAAFEIFQTAILAQDDVIDKSDLRRGKLSLHKSLGGDYKAISQTICLSDLGIFLSYRLLSTLRIEDSLKIKAINFFSQALSQTVLGEMLDIELPSKTFTEKDVLKISLLKTARYTISGPLVLGALLGGMDMNNIKELQKFGDNLGIGFQIQDDILGIFGDEGVTGKSIASDIKEGKATILSAFALQKMDDGQKNKFEKFYGKEDLTKSEEEEVRDLFMETGALEYAKKLGVSYFDLARKSLKQKNGLLYSLVDFVEKRQK